MATLISLIDSVSVGMSFQASHTEPNKLLVDTVSIGRSDVGGHVLAETLLVNTVSAGHASATEFKDMSVIKTIEI